MSYVSAAAAAAMAAWWWVGGANSIETLRPSVRPSVDRHVARLTAAIALRYGILHET